MRRGLGILAIFAGLLLPRIAAAQTTDKVLAEALFREGREKMEANKLAEACPKFAESFKMDPALGTLINLALCHEKDGKTATAWAEFQEAAAQAASEKDDREAFARKHVAALEADLPRLRLVVDPATGALPKVAIKLDGHPIGKAGWTTLLPVDPGDHDVSAEADGKKPYAAKVAVPSGSGTTNLVVPALDDAPKPAPLPPPAVQPDNTGNKQRLFGYILGGVGIIGVGVGGAFGISALNLKSNRDSHCSGNNVCNSTGVDEDTSARHSATGSTIGFIAGGALLAGGIVVILTAAKNRDVTVGVSPNAVTLGGSF